MKKFLLVLYLLALVLAPVSVEAVNYDYISLAGIANWTNHFTDLPCGDVILDGIPYRIQDSNPSFVLTNGGDNSFPSRFTFSARTPNAQSVYLLLNGSELYTQYNGLSIGYLEFHFLNGETQTVQLIAGVNIRDWAPNIPEAIVNNVSDTAVSQVFFGQLDYGGYIARIDALRIDLASSAGLDTIDLVDTSQSTHLYKDAIINVYAATVVSTVPEQSSILTLFCGIGGLSGLMLRRKIK